MPNVIRKMLFIQDKQEQELNKSELVDLCVQIESQCKELEQLNSNWFNLLRSIWKKEPCFVTQEFSEAGDSLFKLLVEAYCLDADEIVAILSTSEYLSQDMLSEIDDYMRKMLQPYLAFDFVRNWQEKDKNNCMTFLCFVFNKIILRFDLESSAAYCHDNGLPFRSFERAAKTLQALTNLYIEKHYTREAIFSDLQMMTGLCDDLCYYYADMIEANYQQLQLNYIIDRLKH